MFFLGKKTDSEQVVSGSAFAELSSNKQHKQLKTALKEQQFVLYLQPRVCLRSWKIQGVEVLLRWQHPDYGLLLPELFLSLLDDCDLMREVSDWQIQQACDLNTGWQKQGLFPLRTSINVSCAQLMNTSFKANLEKVIQDRRINPNYIELELPENCITEKQDQQVALLDSIRNKNIKIAIKCSIQGISSDTHLDELPIDIINIDRELTQQISNNSEKRQIMSTIMSFAHEHALEVVAEGVETAEQLIFLNAMHCDSAQGFLVSPPLKVSDFTKVYQSGKKYNFLIEKISQKL